MDLDCLKQLLGKVSDALSAQKMNGECFNLLHALRVDELENVNSDVLAYILAPSGDHGLETLPLRTFCETCLGKLPKNFMTDFRFRNASVFREYCLTPKDRADFYITDGVYRIVIEAKINATEQKDQISRYWKAIGGPKETNAVYFLTPDGHPATTGEPTACLSWDGNVTGWLIQLLENEAVKKHPYVCEQIRVYCNLLSKKRSTVMDNTGMIDLLTTHEDMFDAAIALYNLEFFKNAHLSSLLTEKVRSYLVDWAEKQNSDPESAVKFDLNSVQVSLSGTKENCYYINTADGKFCFLADFEANDYQSPYYGLHPVESCEHKMFDALNKQLPSDRQLHGRGWYTCKTCKLAGSEWIKSILFGDGRSLTEEMLNNILKDYQDYAQPICDARESINL